MNDKTKMTPEEEREGIRDLANAAVENAVTDDVDALNALARILGEYVTDTIKARGHATSNDIITVIFIRATQTRIQGCLDWEMAFLSAAESIKDKTDIFFNDIDNQEVTK